MVVTQVVHRKVPGEVRHVLEHREVRGVNCNCGPRAAGGTVVKSSPTATNA